MKNLFVIIALLLAINPLFAASFVPHKVVEADKANAILEQSALVCRSKKSLIYLLKSKENYQKIIDGLVSNTIYKNCFLSTVKAGVTVAGHYSNKNLIKNYYVINKHTGKTRYVPIEFITPIDSDKRSTTKYYKKRNKKQSKKLTHKHSKIKKSSKLKKYTQKKKPKVLYKKKKIPVKIKKSNVSRESKRKVIPKVVSKAKHKVEHANNLKSILSSYSETKKKVPVKNVLVQKEILDYKKVYRCSALSFNESFSGEHVDKESSKKMALENCKKYQKNESLCLFENCFILRVNL